MVAKLRNCCRIAAPVDGSAAWTTSEEPARMATPRAAQNGTVQRVSRRSTGDEFLRQAGDERPMNRYFPELLAPLPHALPERCVVDGEIAIVGAGGLDFEALLLRIPPAASGVGRVAAESPASFVAWDLLGL